MKERNTGMMQNCDICGCEENKVWYDAPVYVMGSTRWANTCHSCFMAYRNQASEMGTKLTYRPPVQRKEGKAIRAKELTTIEDAFMDCDRELECPECYEVRTMELDAEGTFYCEGCGQVLHCESLC